MRRAFLVMLMAGSITMGFGGAIASASSDNAATGCDALGVERSTSSAVAGERGWGNGGEYPGVAYDARFGGTEIYGEYIKAWITGACS